MHFLGFCIRVFQTQKSRGLSSVLVARWFRREHEFFRVFSRASAKEELGLSSLSCVWMYVDQNQGITPPLPPGKWHIHWEFLDFKSGFGFTTKIYPRLIFIFKWILSNNSDTHLFLILQCNRLIFRPFQ